jgi:hypothetical protein
MAACKGNERSTARYRSTPASSQMMAFSGNLEDSPDGLVPGQSVSVANPSHSTAKRAGMSRYPCSGVMSAIILGLGEVSFRVEVAQCSKPYATVDRLGRRLCARAPSSSDWSGGRPRHGCWRRLGEQSVRHLPRQWFAGRSGPAGQRAACSIAVHALHAGESAVRDLAERPWHCGQPCNGHFERYCSSRRPRYRVQFAHGPVPAWPPDGHFHFRLIRSTASPIG